MPIIPNEPDIYALIKSGKIQVRFHGPRNSPPEYRFWARVAKAGPIHPILKTKCWLYLHALDQDGYGRISISNKNIKAHRFSWELHYGPIPEGLDVLHRCDNPVCVRPMHLFLGTHSDNHKDMEEKDRHTKGETDGNSKLKDGEVLEIRRRFHSAARKYGLLSSLGREFGVGPSTIQAIVLNKTWRHLLP